MNIHELFKMMTNQGASDLFLTANSVPRARINGRIQELTTEVLTREMMASVADTLLATPERKASYAENQDIDFIHEEPDKSRFRLNVFMQRETPAVVARHVHQQFKTFEELSLPAELLRQLCDRATGIVLVCGPAGSGKSTTIASMLEYINIKYDKHIVTIEDPIEFLFQNKKCIVNQRELGIDVPNYPSALKHVTQQSPDIIFIGNTRDVETMHAAMHATELGCFVLTTFHTINATQTITRIVNFFPPYLHDEVRAQLSLILKGIFSIRLVPRCVVQRS
ncbi:MAG: ATPase, T2SS/T4P/T4SS family, partial [Candidatus Omnitrophota bacterium]|nr:ATPase, T2SS/T4P/T4SS family [Candidatus Omnitrophota bacterium]